MPLFHTHPINPNNISVVSLPNEAEDRKVEEEVHKEPSGRGVRVGAADDDVVLPIQTAVALLQTLDYLETVVGINGYTLIPLEVNTVGSYGGWALWGTVLLKMTTKKC